MSNSDSDSDQPNATDFYKAFLTAVNASLGSAEMADEFWQRHPEIRSKVRIDANMHYEKNPYAPEDCADVFFQQKIQPALKRDRASI